MHFGVVYHHQLVIFPATVQMQYLSWWGDKLMTNLCGWQDLSFFVNNLQAVFIRMHNHKCEWAEWKKNLHNIILPCCIDYVLRIACIGLQKTAIFKCSQPIIIYGYDSF